MQFTLKRRRLMALGAAALAVPLAARAQKKYDVGASDTEIKIGNFVPYSGPASAYGGIGHTYAAYFKKLNEEEGGINGRKITFLSLDDAYNPAQSVEQARRLVERDRVLLLFGMIGTSPNQAVRRYLNQRKVPQLFIATGAGRWGDYQNFPWTMGWQPTYKREGEVLARHILQHQPQAKIGILVQNDDFGKDSLKGILDGLGEKAKTLIVSQQTYEISDPTVDSQLVKLKNSGADTFINLSTPKFAAQSIRRLKDLGWNPVHYLSSVSPSIKAVLRPAGIDNAQGIITFKHLVDPSDPRFKDTQDVQDYLQFMREYYPDGDPDDSINVSGYARVHTMVHTLRQCGDDLTRENIMRQAANLDIAQPPMLLPGVRIKTAPDDYYPIEDVHLVRFEGMRFVPL